MHVLVWLWVTQTLNKLLQYLCYQPAYEMITVSVSLIKFSLIKELNNQTPLMNMMKTVKFGELFYGIYINFSRLVNFRKLH